MVGTQSLVIYSTHFTQLCMNAGTLTTQLLFAGIGGYLGGGVVSVTIVTILDGGKGAPISPVAIEAR